ncbi:MAG: hypothetical protein ACM3ZE_04680, partial [Myxococcales bacterium]
RGGIRLPRRQRAQSLRNRSRFTVRGPRGSERCRSLALHQRDEVGFVLAELVMKHLVPTGGIRLVVDDTLGRHTGKRIAHEIGRLCPGLRI